jgi:hypothetical protein
MVDALPLQALPEFVAYFRIKVSAIPILQKYRSIVSLPITIIDINNPDDSPFFQLS